MPMISFVTHWKHQKTSGFLMFSGGIKRDQVTWNGFTSLITCSFINKLINIPTWRKRNQHYSKYNMFVWKKLPIIKKFRIKTDLLLNKKVMQLLSHCSKNVYSSRYQSLRKMESLKNCNTSLKLDCHLLRKMDFFSLMKAL